MTTGVAVILVVDSDLEADDGARGRGLGVLPVDTETISADVRGIDISGRIARSCRREKRRREIREKREMRKKCKGKETESERKMLRAKYKQEH